MVTKFNLFEKLDISNIIIDTNLDKGYLNYIINNLSINIYKRKNSMKTIGIKSIKGNSNKNTNIKIEMSNKDTIEGNFKISDNSIIIYINNSLIYDVDHKDFNVKKLSEKIVSEYKKHLKNNKWKIK